MTLNADFAQPCAMEAAERIMHGYVERTQQSLAAHRAAVDLLPGGVNRNIVHFGPHPLFIRSAQGAYVTDEDGNRYIDCIGNYTSMVIGHGDPAVVEAVQEQVRRGSAWAGASAGETRLAGMISERLPSIERIRFTASGTEATLMAVRAARAFTGRTLIAKFEGGYHGLHDYAVVSMAPALDEAGPDYAPVPVAPAGIPDAVRDSVVVLPFNDLGAVEAILRRHAPDLACILAEPVPGVAGVLLPEPGFFEGLRSLADEIGCLLIFDEVISFRLSYGGGQHLFGVRPDLTTLGKLIGGGYPIGAVGGRADVMDVFSPDGAGTKVALSGTFHANPVVLAAGTATLERYSRDAIETLNRRAERLFTRVRELLARSTTPVQINAVGSLFNIHVCDRAVRTYRDAQRADRETLRLLHIALLNEGVMLSPRGMGALSTAMSDADLERIVDALGKAFTDLAMR